MTTQNQTTTDDPFDSAMNPTYQEGPKHYFGQLQSDFWHAVWAGDQGYVPFDKALHRIDDRVTRITLMISPLDPSRPVIERKLTAESKAWAKILLPSLKALKTDLRALQHKWVQVQTAPTGRTYEDKHTGEQKQATTLKLLAVYDSEAECQAAMDQFFAERRSQANGDSTAAHSAAESPAAPNSERETAAKFLPALWNMSGKDLTKFSSLLANTSPVNKYFDISSPEVVSLVGAAA